MKKITQPKHKKGARYTGCQPFVIQQPADPEAHLSEEQKKWPLAGGKEQVSDATGTPPSSELPPKLPPV